MAHRQDWEKSQAGMDQAFHHGRPVKEIDDLPSGVLEVQNVADRPMRRSALEEERRNSRHMNLELIMRADELRFGCVDQNAVKKLWVTIEGLRIKTKRTRTRRVRKPESG